MGGGRVKIGGSEGTNSEKVEIELDHTRRMVEGEGMQDIVSEKKQPGATCCRLLPFHPQYPDLLRPEVSSSLGPTNL